MSPSRQPEPLSAPLIKAPTPPPFISFTSLSYDSYHAYIRYLLSDVSDALCENIVFADTTANSFIHLLCSSNPPHPPPPLPAWNSSTLSHMEQYKRNLIHSFACGAGHNACVQKALALFEDFLATGQPPHPDFQSVS